MIFLFFDRGYYKWAEPYLRSLRIFEPDVKVYIRTFNLLKEEVIELLGYDSVVEVKNTKEELCSDGINPRAWKGRNRNQTDCTWMIQIIAQRYGFLLEAMKRFPDEKFWVHTDIDLLIVRPFMESFDSLTGDNDVCLFHRRRKPGIIGAGIIAVRNSENGRLYLSYVDEWLKSQKVQVQGCDQKALRKGFNRFKIHVGPISYVDRRFYIGDRWDEDQTFWCGSNSKFGRKDINHKYFMRILKEIEKRKTTEYIVKKYKLNKKRT